MSENSRRIKRGKKPTGPGYRYGGRKRTLAEPVKLSALIDKSDRDWLKAQAEREGISQGLLVRKLVDSYRKHLERIKEQNPMDQAFVEEDT